MTFNCIHGTCPAYFCDLCHPVYQYFLVHLPGFALQITVILSGTGQVLSDTVLEISSSLLRPSDAHFVRLSN